MHNRVIKLNSSFENAYSHRASAKRKLRDDEGAAEEVTWYAIDANTHGSVAVYSSQEKYEQYKSKLEEYRKDATDEIGAQIVHEFQGLVKASI